MPVPTALTQITNMADALNAADLLLDNLPKPFQAANGPYENLSSQLRPGATRFSTGWFPVDTDAETVQLLGDGLDITADLSWLDEDRGVFTVLPASSVPATSLLIAYEYKRLTDDEIKQSVVQALSKLSFFTDPGQIPLGLYAAFFHYIQAEGFKILSIKYAEQVNVSIMGRSESRSQIAAHFKVMSDQQYKLGDMARIDFYKRAGSREAPAVGRQTYGFPGGAYGWQPPR